MNNIKYDSPRLKEIEDFLTYIYTIGIENANLNVNRGLAYNELCKYGLNKDEVGLSGPKSCVQMFDKWQERNNKNGNKEKGLSLFWEETWNRFLQFFSTDTHYEFQTKEKYIKLYIPIKYNNLFDDVNKLFDFICNSNIKHLSKISSCIRSDNVVIRLDNDDYKAAMQIIDFVNKNFNNKSIGKTNPFVPTVKGVGFTFDNGGTYNGDIAALISSYINNCMSLQQPPVMSGFIKWVKEHNTSIEVQKTFKATIGIETEIQVTEKKVSSKEELFLKSIKATYDKYGIKQVIGAIQMLIRKDDFCMFTNGNDNYRIRMQKMLCKEDVIAIIGKTLNVDINDIDNNKITLFCYKVFGGDIYQKIHKSCMVTFEKYGKNQLFSALNNVHQLNTYGGFTRSSLNPEDQTNYRELISNIPQNVFMDILKLSLGIKLYDGEYYSPNKITNAFIGKYIATKHLDIDSENKKSK